MFQLLGFEVTKAQLSFDTTVISRVQKVGSIVPLETRIYAVWSLNIEVGNILYNSVKITPRLKKLLKTVKTVKKKPTENACFKQFYKSPHCTTVGVISEPQS